MKALTISDLDALRVVIDGRQADRDKAVSERSKLLPGIAADPSSASKLRKLNATISEANTDLQTLEDALADAEVKLEAELRRDRLEQSLAIRQRAARGALQLAELGAVADVAADELIAALAALSKASKAVRSDSINALDQMNPDSARRSDAFVLVLPRASAAGPEVASALAAIVARLKESTSADLSTHFAINGFAVPRGTLQSALIEGAKLIASRLDVKLD